MSRAAKLPIPEPDAENPLPIVLAKDGAVVLSYKAFVARTDVHIIVSFIPAFAHRFTEKHVAKPAAPHEVEDSAWVKSEFGGKGKHFVFAFPNGTFECVAKDYGSETVSEDEDAVRLMSRRLYK